MNLGSLVRWVCGRWFGGWWVGCSVGKWLMTSWSVVVGLMVGGLVGWWPVERASKEHFRVCKILLLY